MAKSIWSLLLLLCVPGALWAQMQTQQAQPPLQDIVARLTQAQEANREHIRAYTVTREYRLFEEQKTEASSMVIADVSFVPPGTKEYEIVNSVGSGQGEKVVRKVLEHEQQMATDWERTALVPENYDFAYAGEDTVNGHRCYVLELKPKRESKDLVRGKAWVDSSNFNVYRITGEPAKGVSWWVKNVQLTLTFAEVSGMWLQTGAQANADVRFFGKRMLTAQDLNYKMSEVSATERPPRAVRATRYGAGAIGAGVILAH